MIQRKVIEEEVQRLAKEADHHAKRAQNLVNRGKLLTKLLNEPKELTLAEGVELMSTVNEATKYAVQSVLADEARRRQAEASEKHDD